MDLSSLKNTAGARKTRKRVGRGHASGHGKTCCRGHKGQGQRKGHQQKLGFEGGQRPLVQRLPKRGFTNFFAKEYETLNVESLEAFENGAVITPELLMDTGMVKKIRDGVKILGDGEITRSLTVKAHRFTASAKAKIEAAGGKTEVI
jgi:large subunit ribosomal protein L15